MRITKLTKLIVPHIFISGVNSTIHVIAPILVDIFLLRSRKFMKQHRPGPYKYKITYRYLQYSISHAVSLENKLKIIVCSCSQS